MLGACAAHGLPELVFDEPAGGLLRVFARCSATPQAPCKRPASTLQVLATIQACKGETARGDRQSALSHSDREPSMGHTRLNSTSRLRVGLTGQLAAAPRSSPGPPPVVLISVAVEERSRMNVGEDVQRSQLRMRPGKTFLASSPQNLRNLRNLRTKKKRDGMGRGRRSGGGGRASRS